MQLVRVTALALFLACVSSSLSAQVAKHEISVAAGVSQFDASGTGTAPLMAARVSGQLLSSWLLGDLSFSYAPLDEQFSTESTRTGVFEGQLQAQLPLARLQPYIGVGGGWLHYFNNDAGRGATAPTISGAVGLRAPLTSALVVRGEMRLRSWDSGQNSGFHDSAAEFTAGLGFAF